MKELLSNKTPFIIVGIFWILNFILPFILPSTERGILGDMFGISNSLFTGMAFAGLLITIALQRQDLELQRNEVSLTREELHNQTLLMNSQLDKIEKQSFENTFFNLITIYNLKINTMQIGNFKSGRASISYLLGTFKSQFSHPNHGQTEEDKIKIELRSFLENNQSEYEHVVWTLSNLLLFVENSSIPNKEFYMETIKTNLSSDELILSYYYYFNEFANPKCLEIYNKYLFYNVIYENDFISEKHWDILVNKKT